MNLYLLNPDNDMALANGSPYYQPPQSAIDMAHDLQSLPAWYMNDGDALLDNHHSIGNDDHLCPWGWNSALLMQANKMGFKNLPAQSNIDLWRRLSHRSVSSDILSELRKRIPSSIGESMSVNNIPDLKKFIDAHPQAILKAPWSSSGRGLQSIINTLSYPMEQWAGRIIRTQEAVMCEPYYNKVCDFAMEFKADKQGVSFMGFSLFRTNGYHMYTGNILASDEDIIQYISQYIPQKTIHTTAKELESILFEKTHNSCYQGCIGIDMMICRHNHTYSLHPCVEMNLRMNMGMLAHIIYNRNISPISGGYYNVDYFKSTETLHIYHKRMQDTYPVQYDEDGKIISGYLSLTPVEKNTRYQAMIWVEKKKDNLMDYFK